MAKIKEVRTKLINGSLGIPDFGSGSDYLLVKVIDEDDNSGIGYIPEIFRFTGNDSLGRVFDLMIKDVLGPYLKGKDSEFLEDIWQDLFKKTTRWGRRGIVLASIGALDMALWDLMGKTASKPVWRLIGGYRKEVPTYANTAHDLDPKTLASKAAEYVEQGFDAVKIRGSLTAVPPDVATERIRQVREAVGPDVKIMVDLNGTYPLSLATRVLKKWEKYELFWVEEPVHPDSMESFVRLRKEVDIPIATGEQHGTLEDFKRLLDSGAVDIVQPDVIYVGGVTEWLNVCALAKSYGVPVSPHLNELVSAHFVASRSNTLWIEYTAEDNPLGKTLHSIFSGPGSILQAKNGKVEAPEKPGFGFELRKEFEF